MPNKPIFTMVIATYNQPKTIYQTIDSILEQTYESIELIIADDCSQSFEYEKIETYIKQNKKENLVGYKIHSQLMNVGTVKNLNTAIDMASGTYIGFIAGDDCVYSNETINNYVKTFDSLPDSNMIVAGQCYMYDRDLKELGFAYINAELALSYNELSPQDQAPKMFEHVFYGVGGMAFKTEIFKEFQKFDERYKLVEDWSYLLQATRAGYKVFYADFGALKHRDGGVSHHKDDHIPAHLFDYWNDLLLVSEYEILPHMKGIPLREQLHFYERYAAFRANMKETFLQNNYVAKRKSRKEIIFNDSKFATRLVLRYLGQKASIIGKSLLVTLFLLLLVYTGLGNNIYTDFLGLNLNNRATMKIFEMLITLNVIAIGLGLLIYLRIIMKRAFSFLSSTE